MTMRLIHHWTELPTPPVRTVLTIGNFDGVHRGHREVFRRVILAAQERQGTSAVYTFCPHPLQLLAPERAPLLITPPEEKARLIAAAGIDLLLCPPFDHATAGLTPAEFVAQVLVARLRIAHLVVGADYAFGRGRSGDVAFLQREGGRLGFSVEALAPVGDDQGVCSSTRIRTLIGQGRVDEAASLLGRHFSLAGTVVHGDKRGRQLGFPTANLDSAQRLCPGAGVYAVKVRLEGRDWDGVANIGCKPTYGGPCGIEVHLLEGGGELYGRTLQVFFLQRLREERQFASSGALVQAIGEDVARARTLLAGIPLRDGLSGDAPA